MARVPCPPGLTNRTGLMWQDAQPGRRGRLGAYVVVAYPRVAPSTLSVLPAWLTTKAWLLTVSLTTSMGRWPTGMVRSTRPVLLSRTLTVLLPVLAMKTWPLVSSTATSLGAVPTATVRSSAPLSSLSTLTVLAATLATKTRPVFVSTPSAIGPLPTRPVTQLRGAALPTVVVRSTAPDWSSRTLTVPLPRLATKARPVVLSMARALGSWPTWMVRTTRPVLALSRLTVPLPLLATKTRLVVLSTSTAIG